MCDLSNFARSMRLNYSFAAHGLNTSPEKRIAKALSYKDQLNRVRRGWSLLAAEFLLGGTPSLVSAVFEMLGSMCFYFKGTWHN